MSTFAFKSIEEVANGKLFFQKVIINEECLFDTFCESIKQPQYKSELRTILSYMNFLANNDQMLPATKFNSIQSGKNTFGYEFKTKHLRAYLVKKKPNAWIILGGYKTNQKKDIEKFEKIVEEMNKLNLL